MGPQSKRNVFSLHLNKCRHAVTWKIYNAFYALRVLGAWPLLNSHPHSDLFFLARERHFYTLSKVFLGRGSKAWEWGPERIRRELSYEEACLSSTARTRFSMHEKYTVVSERQLCILLSVCKPPL